MGKTMLSLALVGSLVALSSSVKINAGVDAESVPTPGGTPWPTFAPVPTESPTASPPALTESQMAAYNPPPTETPTPQPTGAPDGGTAPPFVFPDQDDNPAPAPPPASDPAATRQVDVLDLFETSTNCQWAAGALDASKKKSTQFQVGVNAQEECAKKCAETRHCNYYQVTETRFAVSCEWYNTIDNAGTNTALSKVARNSFGSFKFNCGTKLSTKPTCAAAFQYTRFNCAGGFDRDDNKNNNQCGKAFCETSECCKACSNDKGVKYDTSKTAKMCTLTECEVGYTVDTATNTCVAASPYGNTCPAHYYWNDDTALNSLSCPNSAVAGQCQLSGLEAFVWCSSDAGQTAGCSGVEQAGDGTMRAGKGPSVTVAGSRACMKITTACTTNADCSGGENCKNGYCEVVNAPSWSSQATPTPPPTPAYSLDQYDVQYGCNFQNFYSLGSKNYPGTEKWSQGSKKVCSEFCDQTQGCYAWVLSKDRTQCSITSLGSGNLEGLGKQTQKWNFICATKKASWLPKCATHVCHGLSQKKASWSAASICENDFSSGGDTHNCQKTCCEEKTKSAFLSAGCNTAITNGGCDDGLRLYEIGDSSNFGTSGVVPDYTRTKSITVPNNDVMALVASSDLSKAVIASTSKVIVMAVSSGSAVLTMSGHTGTVVALDVDFTSNKAISGGSDGTIRVWDMSTGSELKNFPAAHDGKEVTAVKIDFARNAALSAGKDRVVQSWDLNTDLPSKQGMHMGTGGIYAMDANFELKYGITGGYDNVLKLWKLDATMHLVHTLTRDKRYAHSSYIRCVKADFAKMLAVSGSWDNTAKIWDLKENRLIRTLSGHTNSVRALDVNFDTGMIFTGSWDKDVRVWNMRTGLAVTTVTGVHDDVLRGIAARADISTAYCLAWGCSCQGAADAFGIDPVGGFSQTIPADVRKWFMAHRCTESAQQCKDYTAAQCSANYCYLNFAGISVTCTDAPPTPYPTPAPTYAPTPAPTKKVYHAWFKNIPVIGPILTLIMDTLGKMPVIGDMLTALNSGPQAVFEKNGDLFDSVGGFGKDVLGSFKENSNEAGVSFKQNADAPQLEGDIVEGDIGAEEEVTPEIEVFNKDQAESLIQDLKQGMGF